MRRVLLASLALAGMLTLSACDPPAPGSTLEPEPGGSISAEPTPTPTPAPTAPPAVEDLALSADGMGTLQFGEAPDAAPATRMIVEDPEACSEFAPAGTPEATRWRPIPLYGGGAETLMFGVEVTDGLLQRIDVLDPEIPTEAGVKITDTDDTVVAAYPGATLVENDLTDIYVVTGSRGTLQIEVARARGAAGYWPSAQVDHVVYLHATIAGVDPFSVAASENIAGGCL
jgi:hypothetical protein